jgi:hypothetical protein
MGAPLSGFICSAAPTDARRCARRRVRPASCAISGGGLWWLRSAKTLLRTRPSQPKPWSSYPPLRECARQCRIGAGAAGFC